MICTYILFEPTTLDTHSICLCFASRFNLKWNMLIIYLLLWILMIPPKFWSAKQYIDCSRKMVLSKVQMDVFFLELVVYAELQLLHSYTSSHINLTQ
jgi:hypothetical protein